LQNSLRWVEIRIKARGRRFKVMKMLQVKIMTVLWMMIILNSPAPSGPCLKILPLVLLVVVVVVGIVAAPWYGRKC
jgi:hypothetical protein